MKKNEKLIVAIIFLVLVGGGYLFLVFPVQNVHAGLAQYDCDQSRWEYHDARLSDIGTYGLSSNGIRDYGRAYISFTNLQDAMLINPTDIVKSVKLCLAETYVNMDDCSGVRVVFSNIDSTLYDLTPTNAQANSLFEAIGSAGVLFTERVFTEADNNKEICIDLGDRAKAIIKQNYNDNVPFVIGLSAPDKQTCNSGDCQVNFNDGYSRLEVDIQEVTCNTPADTNCNNAVSTEEIISYGQKWLNGQITKQELIQAATVWIGA